MDLYQILEIGRGSSAEEVKKAYRTLSKKHHPDKNEGSKEAEEKFKEISNAYSILSDPDKKAYYDRTGQIPGSQQQNHHQQSPFDFNDIFSQFGDMFGGGRQAKRNSDLRMKISLTLEEIMLGINKKVKYKRDVACNFCNGHGGEDPISCTSCGGRGTQDIIQRTNFGHMRQTVTCPTCNGFGKNFKKSCTPCNGSGTKSVEETVDLDIPAGAISGTYMTQQKGGNYSRGGDYGDLNIQMEEIPNNNFIRDGLNIQYQVKITIIEALLGKEFRIILPTGKEIKFNIPERTEPGKVFRIGGKGIPNVQRPGQIGDLMIQVMYKMPNKITLEEKKILEELNKKVNFQ